MKIKWAFCLFLMLTASVAIAQDDKKSDQSGSDQKELKEDSSQEEQEDERTAFEKFSDLKKEHARSERMGRSRMRRARASEREELATKLEEEAQAFVQSISELVGDVEEPEQQIEILLWMNTNGAEDDNSALEQLLTKHIESEKLTALIPPMLRTAPNSEKEQAIRTLIKDSPHETVRAAATLGMIDMLAPLKRLASADEQTREAVSEMVGKEFMDKWTAEAIDEESDAMLKSLMDNYADVPLGNSTYGARIEAQIFAKERLAVGCEAEDIVGNDLDGEEFKLSDYRGKVVVLDFWGDW